ncbi:MAG TPA: tetratricopeptide repeat protein [Spirochaetia bacterium]|nr:tetratricopeptide repeat protein [Spirochaetia bacterium]
MTRLAGRMRWATCAVCACMALASCSTAPARTDTVTAVKKQAADASAVGDGYFHQGRYDLAIQFFDQALSYSTSVDDQAGIVLASIAIGKVYMTAGSLDDAERILAEARDRARAADPRLLFLSSINLGELYLRKARPQDALAVFEQAKTMPDSARTSAQNAILLHDMGTARKSLDDLPGALGLFTQSLKINLDLKLGAEAASDYYMIASVYSKQGDYDNAARNAQLALEADKKVENAPAIAQDLYALGLIDRKRQGFSAAYDWFLRSYQVSLALSMRAEMRKALTEMASCADALGNGEDAESARKLLADLGNP